METTKTHVSGHVNKARSGKTKAVSTLKSSIEFESRFHGGLQLFKIIEYSLNWNK
jgi:hypothetical protein